MTMIFPAGAKRYDWIPKLAEDEKLGTELLDLSKLPGASPVVDAAEAVVGAPGETPAVEAVEVAVEAKPEDAKPCDCKEKVQELAQEAKEVVEEAKEVADKAKELVELVVGEDGEVTLPKAEEVPAAVEAPLTSETAGEAEKAEEKAEEAEEKAEESTVVASEQGRFVKIAALSKENKAKLVDYWKNVLGYDAKYVQYMVTDYEK